MVPRNIRRLEAWQLASIISGFEALPWSISDQASQDFLYDELAKLGVKCKRNSGGISNAGGLRTYLAQLACLGFYVKTDRGWRLTRAGEQMKSGNNPLDVFRCQLLRMQYPSVYGLGHNVRISPELRVKPFVFLIRLLKDDRIGSLTSNEAAVAVIYGRTFKDFEKVAEKILQLRSSGDDLSKVVERTEDVCTPRRSTGVDLLERGCHDANDIGNTFLNYLKGAMLAVPSEELKGAVVLTEDPKALSAIDRYSADAEQISDVEEGFKEAWQYRFGRYDRDKDTRSHAAREQTDGFASMIALEYINAVKANPLGFDHADFVRQQSEKWGKDSGVVEAACRPLRDRVRSIERDTIKAASVSGGEQSFLFEKGVFNLFRSLGFSSSELIGQKKADGRQGGYPDVYVLAPGMDYCGMADAKSTARYTFPLFDQEKLSSYYHSCELEINAKIPSKFFVYVAGGFGKSADNVRASLQDCSRHYGRAVSAVTVDALFDLLDMDDDRRPSAAFLAEKLSQGGYFGSAVDLVK